MSRNIELGLNNNHSNIFSTTDSTDSIDSTHENHDILSKKERLDKYFKTKGYHYTIISIVFLDISLLACGLVLVTYNRPDTLLTNKILFYISWVFPAIFYVEIFTKMWLVGGMKMYFDNWIKIADFIILTFSVISDIILYVLLMEHAPATATAVIVFRMYKIFRLFHVYSHIQQMNAENGPKELMEENQRLTSKIYQLKAENQTLKTELEKYKKLHL